MNIMRFIVLGSWLASVLTGAPQPWQIEPPQPEAPNAERLVIFEGFFKPGCGLSASTGPVVEMLSQEYADQVVFIEYNSLDPASIERMDRWWAGYGAGTANMPLTMVDSGFRTHAGFNSVPLSYAQHEAMILDALDRPPEADISATWERVGDAVRFNVDVTNKSGVTLGNDNFAAVHVIVYEENFVLYTGRFMRAHAAKPVGTLEDGATAEYVITTPGLSEVDWNKLHFIALIDYLTPEGWFDMLQAAKASSLLSVTPTRLMFFAPEGGPNPTAQTFNVLGPAGISWRAEEAASWIQITAESGVMPAQASVAVNVQGLQEGIYSHDIIITAGSISKKVTVIAAVGELHWASLPVVIR